jgi:hypothetical protein
MIKSTGGYDHHGRKIDEFVFRSTYDDLTHAEPHYVKKGALLGYCGNKIFRDPTGYKPGYKVDIPSGNDDSDSIIELRRAPYSEYEKFTVPDAATKIKRLPEPAGVHPRIIKGRNYNSVLW